MHCALSLRSSLRPLLTSSQSCCRHWNRHQLSRTKMSKPGLAEPPGRVQLTAMRSDYNQLSKNQSRVLQAFKPFIDSAVAAHSSGVDGSGIGGAFVVADFGCSTGLNSSDAVSHVIGEVRKKYAGERCSSVLVVLNDLPRNDWCELFHFLHGDERSFLRQHRGVFAVSSGKSFYEQVLPDNSLQLGISCVCLHWCSQLPVKMANHCFAMFASDEERELFRQQAAEDWSNFLTARSKELVSGGVLALSLLTTQLESRAIFEAIENSAKALHSRGVITSEELLNFNVRICFRSVEDVSNQSQYERLGLELLRAEKFPPTRSVYYEDFLKHGDVGRFALDYSNSCCATCEPSFLGCLSPGRSDHEKAAICAELWREHRARIAERPGDFEFTWAIMSLAVRKN